MGLEEVPELRTDREGIIRVMPSVLANKIAAGEVVGRPSSVIKELVENSLDAGASSIEIVLSDSGRTLIQVLDNGSGMATADAEMCFQRHATSKIKEFSDLDRIHTLGFRGEALASIGSVGRVELKTRRHEDETGTRVVVEGGEQFALEPCAAPEGTSIAVRNLFYNVPARRAFLKSDATELGHMIETVQMLAISHPAVAFRLVHDGMEVLRLAAAPPADEGLLERIEELFGHDRNLLLPVQERTSYLGIRGWIGQPELRRKSRGEQYLFVNGRAIRSRYLEHAVYGAYRGLLPEGSFPFFVLSLDVDTRHVDVNVHPTKAEVKFDDERGVYSMLRAVVGRALSLGVRGPRFEDQPVDLLAGTGSPPQRGSRTGDGYPGEPHPPGVASVSDPGKTSMELYAPSVEARNVPSGGAGESADSDTLVWQLLGTYIVAPIRSGLLVVDQHAAHERVIFERAQKALEDGFGLSQQLLFPTVIDFPAAEFALLEGLLPDLRAIGFDVVTMSGRSVMVRGLPADIRTGDERQVLTEVLDEYRQFAQRLRLPSRELLARAMARRSAVRRETRLDPKEMRSLIDQLFQCQDPRTSPSGQPTLIQITGDELARRFGNRE